MHKGFVNPKLVWFSESNNAFRTHRYDIFQYTPKYSGSLPTNHSNSPYEISDEWGIGDGRSVKPKKEGQRKKVYVF